jgi:chloride channel protein, CIC family
MDQREPRQGDRSGAGAPGLPDDTGALIRSRPYRMLLVLAALIGVVVSSASWGFLEIVHLLQIWVYEDLPGEFGFSSQPIWWELPWLALAGAITAVAISRFPGRGGHVPADGLQTGGKPTSPIELPGVVIAATATLGLGLVLGPEAPLLALGSALGILAIKLVKKDAPDQVLGLMAAAGSFAAISTVFGSPVIGAVIIIEAAGIGGSMLTLVLLPGLVSAGIGSLVFIGLGSWSGLSTSAWALAPFPLPPTPGPGRSDFFWTILVALAAAVVVFAIMELGLLLKHVVEQRIVPLTIAAGIAVGALAILFAEVTDQPASAVLFSGQEAFGSLFAASGTIALTTLALLLLLKGLAWSISLGNFRGGPTFPAIFLGVVGGLLASHLPGYAETQAIAALVGAACVAVLRLPFSSVVIATLLTAKAGLAVAPIAIVAVVVAYLASLTLTAYVDARVGRSAGREEPTAAPVASTG